MYMNIELVHNDHVINSYLILFCQYGMCKNIETVIVAHFNVKNHQISGWYRI